MKLFDIDKLVENLTGYIETKIELIQLDVKEELTQLIAKTLAHAIVLLFGLLAIFFVSLGLSALLNDQLESSYHGYLIVGLFYLVLAGVFFGVKSSVVTKITKEASKESEGTDIQ